MPSRAWNRLSSGLPSCGIAIAPAVDRGERRRRLDGAARVRQRSMARPIRASGQGEVRREARDMTSPTRELCYTELSETVKTPPIRARRARLVRRPVGVAEDWPRRGRLQGGGVYPASARPAQGACPGSRVRSLRTPPKIAEADSASCAGERDPHRRVASASTPGGSRGQPASARPATRGGCTRTRRARSAVSPAGSRRAGLGRPATGGACPGLGEAGCRGLSAGSAASR